MRKKFEEAFKARVAIEAIKCEKTLSQISSEYGVHSNLVSRWKQELLKGAAEVFGKPTNLAIFLLPFALDFYASLQSYIIILIKIHIYL